MQLSQLFSALKEHVLPRLCVGCNRPGELLCSNCRPSIPYLYEQICPVCQHPSISGLTHPRCKSPWSIDGVVALTKYRGISKSIIKQIKYRGATVVTEIVRDLVGDYQRHESLHLPPSIITPIPLHPKTRQQRGFNQASLIAQQLSLVTGLPFVDDILIRQKQTISQTTLSKTERQANVKGIFSIGDINKGEFKGASILLVDDVFTTSATLREAAKVLKRAGAAKVYGFTLAHD